MQSVLILDDDEIVRKSLVYYFEDTDWLPLEAESGDEGLAIIAERQPDAAVIDQRLPGMDGDAFIRQAMALNRDMAYVIFSGSIEYELPPDLMGCDCVSNRFSSNRWPTPNRWSRKSRTCLQKSEITPTRRNDMKALNPDNVVKPASNYVQAVVHRAAAERMVISGQLGLAPDGTLADGLEAQMEQAWKNVFGVMQAGGFAREDLIRATIYVTVPGSVSLYRYVRDRMLDGHRCANTYLEISALAAPEFLVEIEAEAVRE